MAIRLTEFALATSLILPATACSDGGPAERDGSEQGYEVMDEIDPRRLELAQAWLDSASEVADESENSRVRAVASLLTRQGIVGAPTDNELELVYPPGDEPFVIILPLLEDDRGSSQLAGKLLDTSAMTGTYDSGLNALVIPELSLAVSPRLRGILALSHGSVALSVSEGHEPSTDLRSEQIAGYDFQHRLLDEVGGKEYNRLVTELVTASKATIAEGPESVQTSFPLPGTAEIESAFGPSTTDVDLLVKRVLTYLHVAFRVVEETREPADVLTDKATLLEGLNDIVSLLIETQEPSEAESEGVPA